MLQHHPLGLQLPSMSHHLPNLKKHSHKSATFTAEIPSACAHLALMPVAELCITVFMNAEAYVLEFQIFIWDSVQ